MLFDFLWWNVSVIGIISLMYMTSSFFSLRSHRSFWCFIFVFSGFLNCSILHWDFDTILAPGLETSMSERVSLCFILYLLFDLYLFHVNKTYRKDLLLHHLVCLFVFIYGFHEYSNLGNFLLLAESLSICNSLLTTPYLEIYRLVILLFVRFPIWFLILCHDFDVNESILCLRFFFPILDLYFLRKLILHVLK